MVYEINEEIKKQDILKAERSIEYLNNQINKTQLSELKERLYDLVQSQAETIMLANASPEYVFQTIDPAVAAEQKHSPDRLLISMIGILVGFLLSTILSVLFFFMNKKVRLVIGLIKEEIKSSNMKSVVGVLGLGYVGCHLLL